MKRSCIEAYRLLDQGLQSSRVANRALDADVGNAGAERVAELVAAAERDLTRARELTGRCSELEGEIARRYGL